LKENLTLVSEPEKDYELIDSGEGEKLERYGSVVLSRPDPQAIWPKANPEVWKNAAASFGGPVLRQGGPVSPKARQGGPVSPKARQGGEGKGKWREKTKLPESWPINFGGLTFGIRLSAFKHTGIFPEHKPSWEWMSGKIAGEKRKVSVLNLFGYTGGATLAAAKAGAETVHLDGSKVAVSSAKENAKMSGLAEKPIRWIIDDATAFVKREARRGNKYDGIVMDPPAYGHGPEGEMWQIEDDLLKMLFLCREIISEKPLFILLNGYAAGYSAIGYANMLEEVFPFAKNGAERGEIGIRETERGIILPSGIFARWGA